MKIMVELAVAFAIGAVGFWVCVVVLGLIYGLLVLPVLGLWAYWRRQHGNV